MVPISEGRVGLGSQDAGGFPLSLNSVSPGCELRVPYSLITTGCVQMKLPVRGGGVPDTSSSTSRPGPATCSNKP